MWLSLIQEWEPNAVRWLARIGNQIYVGPDNGTITMLVEYGQSHNWELKFIHLDRPAIWREPVSHVFHGRDIFAPVAAHLANGVSPRSS